MATGVPEFREVAWRAWYAAVAGKVILLRIFLAWFFKTLKHIFIAAVVELNIIYSSFGVQNHITLYGSPLFKASGSKVKGANCRACTERQFIPYSITPLPGQLNNLTAI
ncbi:hypothetical protein BMR05_12840 [Methylococcaceae bacterium HT4]|nr:hypothetical protein BMR05_12840 [Methylococcaceae bacterium HT4]TXL17527.1 hypothetical protein BMR06_14760 [Methylococcaceae bacterium HT5]